MKLTQFGRTVRTLRMEYDISLKEMATAMGISAPYLSAIEYGEKKLNDKHIRAAVSFFADRATALQIEGLRDAAEKSKDTLNTSALSVDAKVLVAAFARRLQEGKSPTPDIESWLSSRQ